MASAVNTSETSSSSNSDLSYEVQSKLCSNICKKTVTKYRNHNIFMNDELKRYQELIDDYKRGIESVEKQLKAYQKNEEQYIYDLDYAKWEKNELKLNIENLQKDLAQVKIEKESISLKVDQLENASKSVSNIIKAQIHDKLKTGLGYTAVPPPYNNNYFPSKPDINFEKLKEGVNSIDIKVDPVFTSSESDELTNASSESESESESFKSISASEKQVEANTGLQMKITDNKSRHGLGYISKPTATVNVLAKEHSAQSCCSCNCKSSVSSNSYQGPKENHRSRNQKNLGSGYLLVQRKACSFCGRTNHLQKDCFYKPKSSQTNKNVKTVWTAVDRVNKKNSSSKVNSFTAVKRKPTAVKPKSAGRSSADRANSVISSAVSTNQKTAAKSYADKQHNAYSVTKAATACWVWKPKVKSIENDISLVNKSNLYSETFKKVKPKSKLIWVPKRN